MGSKASIELQTIPLRLSPPCEGGVGGVGQRALENRWVRLCNPASASHKQPCLHPNVPPLVKGDAVQARLFSICMQRLSGPPPQPSPTRGEGDRTRAGPIRTGPFNRIAPNPPPFTRAGKRVVTPLFCPAPFTRGLTPTTGPPRVREASGGLSAVPGDRADAARSRRSSPTRPGRRPCRRNGARWRRSRSLTAATST